MWSHQLKGLRAKQLSVGTIKKSTDIFLLSLSHVLTESFVFGINREKADNSENSLICLPTPVYSHFNARGTAGVLFPTQWARERTGEHPEKKEEIPFLPPPP